MTKILIFMRHGDYHKTGRSILTNTGRKQVNDSSAHLENCIKNKNYVIMHSPELRAGHSAELVNDFMGNGHELVSNQGLAIDQPILMEHFVYQEIRELDDNVDVAILITHQPFLSKQVALFKWNNYALNDDLAGGYIVEVDNWSDVSRDTLGKKGRPIAAFTPKKLDLF